MLAGVLLFLSLSRCLFEVNYKDIEVQSDNSDKLKLILTFLAFFY